MSKSRLRRTSFLASVAVGLALSSAAGAQAANNPGTGDSGFFTFRPSTAVGGTQINVASGNALVRTRDLADSDGNYHVVVDRAYNSLASDAFSILSPRWGFDVGPATKLTVQNNGDALVTGPSGYRILFSKQADGTFTAPAGFDGSLVASSSGWTLSRASQGDQFGFNGSGQLSWTKDSQARDFTVQGTSAAGRDVLSSYGTNSGRRVNLSYNGDSLVREMDDPSSGHHYYGYTNGKLTSYRSPSGAETTYHYGTNGYLDKITDAGGTTVELTTTSAGKVQSITTTLPGAAGQTTSFVYTRRPYKTDVTGPDGVRRTYAFDDDWRVTRQYNPDVKPTTDARLAGDTAYAKGSEPIPVHVTSREADGAGVSRIEIRDEDGTKRGEKALTCAETAFDRVCPVTVDDDVNVNMSGVPEGRHALRAVSVDDEGNEGASEPFDVIVDRSGPAFPPDSLEVTDYDPDAGSALVEWASATDSTLPGGTPGVGLGYYLVRFAKAGEPLGAWVPTPGNSVSVPSVAGGDDITVEVVPYDSLGNPGNGTSATLAVSSEEEDDTPAVETDDDDPIADDDLSGDDLNPFGVGRNDESGGSGLFAASQADPPAPANPENCPDYKNASTAPGQRSYAWFHFRRKPPTAAERDAGQTVYNLHMQARSAYKISAAKSYLEIWVKQSAGQKKRRRTVKQTDFTRPKTLYYAHTRQRVAVHTFFRWYGVITWKGDGIYERTIRIGNNEVDIYTKTTHFRGGCVGVWHE